MKFRTVLLLGGKTATGIRVPPDVVSALGQGKRPAVRVTINGHTDAQSTPADLRESARFLRAFVDAARAAKHAGRTPAHFAAEWKPPAAFKGYLPVTNEGPGPGLSQDVGGRIRGGRNPQWVFEVASGWL